MQSALMFFKLFTLATCVMWLVTMHAATAITAPPAPDSPTSALSALASSPYVRGALGGAAYGLVAAAISHPFDTVKTRLQTQTVVGSASVLSRLAGLYKGIGPATAASILFRTVPFIGYEATHSALRSRQLLERQPLLAAFLGGVVGGVMRGCLETPAELLKTRLQVGAGVGPAAVLLRGLYSTCLRNAAAVGVFWVAFEASAAWRAHLPPVAASFVGGGGCSVLAWMTIFPLDTAKSRIQASSGGSTNVVTQLAHIYREHGIRGWYAGLGAGLLRAFLANGGGMAIYSIVVARLAALPRDGVDKREL